MRKFQFALAIAGLGASALAAAQAAAPSSNTAATRTYYQQVMADPARGAELALLATLLPKGGDLHHHYSGSIYAETYLDWMGRLGKCLHTGSWKIDGVGAPEGPGDGGHCATADEIRGDGKLYQAVLMRWSDKDFANHSHEEPPPDQKFFETFGLFSAVAGYATHEGLEQIKQRAVAENVQYIETMLRIVASDATPANAAALNALNPASPTATIDAALAAALESLESNPAEQDAVRLYQATVAADAAGIDGDGFAMRFQAYVFRGGTPAQVFTELYGAFKAAQDSPLIVGVNIVGAENGVVAMRDYALHMRMFHFLKARFPATHLALHAGELAVGMVPPEGLRFHIRQAIEVGGAERIGHGVDIAQEDDAIGLLQEMKRGQRAVEINLTSNAFILGVEGNAHPLTLYRRAGVPIVISTDDAGVSRSSLSHEYALFIARYRPSYDELKEIVRNSIRYSFLPAADKQSQLQALDARFQVFEARIAHSPLPRKAAP